MYGRRLVLQAVQRPDHQPAWVQHMLRLVNLRRPARTGFELDSQKISNFAKHAVPYDAIQLTLGIADAQRRLQRYGVFYLDAGAGQGDVLEIRHATSRPPRLVLPSDVYHVRAQHPGLNPTIHHTLV